MGEQAGIAQHAAQIRPDQRVEGLGGGVARRAALATGRPEQIGASPAHIVGVAPRPRAAGAGELTASTTQQAAQQVGLRRVVAPRHLRVAIQLRLGGVEGGRTDERGHGDRNPLLGGGGLLRIARTDWS